MMEIMLIQLGALMIVQEHLMAGIALEEILLTLTFVLHSETMVLWSELKLVMMEYLMTKAETLPEQEFCLDGTEILQSNLLLVMKFAEMESKH